jgi:hypothetical protein
MAALHLNKEDIADIELSEASAASPNGTKVFDDNVSHVPEKYRGTAADRRDMTVMGKKQVLRVSITVESITALILIIE